MSPFLALFLVLLLGATSYAAGRLHGQLSYRIGYRFGYRQGYFDGDRGAWNRRRRDAQAAIATALSVTAAPASARVTGTVVRGGTTYTGSSFATPAAPVTGRHPAGALARRTG
ncbi:hypothetical protein GA0070616_3533 [Micromonospora nigra]|uniref:Uncharacterized protein n=1 Tax=Micromonospora nigra TaxID=145857 RepID=A0A1C6SDQ0_9ACTN|nr:hypothetical protein [Micromonospora nigra]SCL27612.1 hypothetical protein GA0070616_3533 [Micromonospora nigra]